MTVFESFALRGGEVLLELALERSLQKLNLRKGLFGQIKVIPRNVLVTLNVIFSEPFSILDLKKVMSIAHKNRKVLIPNVIKVSNDFGIKIDFEPVNEFDDEDLDEISEDEDVIHEPFAPKFYFYFRIAYNNDKESPHKVSIRTEELVNWLKLIIVLIYDLINALSQETSTKIETSTTFSFFYDYGAEKELIKIKNQLKKRRYDFYEEKGEGHLVLNMRFINSLINTDFDTILKGLINGKL